MAISEYKILKHLNDKSDKKHRHKIEDIKDISKLIEPYAKTKDVVKNEALELVIKDFNDKVSNITLKQGKPGKTPIKGLDYTDGYTPIKNKDYFDGKNGITPIISEVETETLLPNEFADVEIKRIENNEYKFKFKIPKGKDGSDNGRSVYGMASEEYVDEKVSTIVVPTKVSDLEIDINTDDIPDTETNRYTNDTDINRLANTSGTNTGDNPRIVSQVIVANYAQSSAMDNGKVYTYIRDEDNVIIETEVV